MCARVVDDQVVPLLHLGQHPVDGEFVIVLTEGTHYVILVIAGSLLLPHDRNMMIGAIHSRTHKIYRTGIHTDIFLMGMLLMNRLCHQTSVRPQHKPPQLRIDSHISHACRSQHFLIDPSHPFTDCHNIIGLLIRTIGNPDSS